MQTNVPTGQVQGAPSEPAAAPGVMANAQLFYELKTFGAAFERRRGPSADPASSDDFKLLSLFGNVFERVRTDYVKEVDDHVLISSAVGAMEKLPIGSPSEELIEAALKGMLTSLDDRSDYLNSTAFRAIQVSSRGDIGAIGVEGAMDGAELRVLDVFDNSPAARAGLLPGDRITSIEGKTLNGLRVWQAMEMLRGPIGSEVNFALRRASQPHIVVKITREVVRNEEVKARLDDGIGYIRVSQFVTNTANKLHNAIDRLRAGGKPSGYVLDLRNDPGGLLDQAVAVAGYLLDKGEILTTQTRRPEKVQRYAANGKDLTEGVPMVVLINDQTASGAEIVAAALHDNHRAILLGTRSYGQGSIQTIIPVPGHGAVRLTTSNFQTPSGRPLQGAGLEPDITVAWIDPPALAASGHLLGDATTDVQYARAAEFLRRMAPGSGADRAR